MKRPHPLFSLLALASLSTSQAPAETLSYAAAQVQVQVPDGWKQEPSENSLSITAPDSTMTVVFSVLEAQDINEAIKTLDAEVEKAVGKISWNNDGKATELTINGMSGKEFAGTANEGAMVVDEIVLDTPAQKVLTIYWFSTPESDKKYADEIKMIVHGIKPMGAGAKTLSFDSAQVQIQIPDGWKADPSENTLTITSPEPGMTVVFSVLEAQNLNDALTSIDGEVEKAIGKIAWKNEGKGQDISINGMGGKEFVGTASEGALVVDEIVLDTPAQKVLAIYWFSTPEADKKYSEEIKAIVQGVQPMEASGEGEDGEG